MAPCSLISISSLSILWLSSIVFSGIPDLTDDQLYELVVTNNKNDHEFVKCTFADQTTNPIYIEVRPDWAPLGAARFVELVKDGHFWKMAMFRGLENFIVQFGLASTDEQRNKWRGKSFSDDPPNEIPFRRGIMSFAGSGPNSRGEHVFICLTDRKTHLGQQPWEVPFAEVIYGKENLDSIVTKYGDQVSQQEIWRQGYRYLKDNFPDLTYLEDCEMVKVLEKAEKADL